MLHSFANAGEVLNVDAGVMAVSYPNPKASIMLVVISLLDLDYAILNYDA